MLDRREMPPRMAPAIPRGAQLPGALRAMLLRHDGVLTTVDQQHRQLERGQRAAIVLRASLQIDPHVAERRQVRGARRGVRASRVFVVDEDVYLPAVGFEGGTREGSFVQPRV